MKRKRRRSEPKATTRQVKALKDEDAKARFLEKYAETGSLAESASAAGRSRSIHYKWLKEDEGYAAAFELATDAFIETLEMEVDRRAFRGVEEPVFYQGEEVARVRKFSDILAMFRLKALRPDKYRERTEVKQAGEVKVVIEDDPNWYGNDGHSKAAEGTAPPTSDPA